MRRVGDKAAGKRRDGTTRAAQLVETAANTIPQGRLEEEARKKVMKMMKMRRRR
jgi:hypothetical protein